MRSPGFTVLPDGTCEIDVAAYDAGQPHWLTPVARPKFATLIKYSEDQPRDDDGRWTSGGSASASYANLIERVGKPDGGFTVSMAGGEEPASGFAVSPYKDRSLALKPSQVTLHALASYVAKNRDLLGRDGHYLGAWNDPADGTVYLDISILADTAEMATELAKTHDQIAYYDLRRGQSVDVDRTATSGGQKPKAHAPVIYAMLTRVRSVPNGQQAGLHLDAADGGGARRADRAIDGEEAHGRGSGRSEEDPRRDHAPVLKAKVSKVSVHYREASGPERCGTCTMYADHTCSLVAGAIAPEDVCDRWEGETKGYTKYREDQARDEGGRFADEAGSGLGTATAEEPAHEPTTLEGVMRQVSLDRMKNRVADEVERSSVAPEKKAAYQAAATKSLEFMSAYQLDSLNLSLDAITFYDSTEAVTEAFWHPAATPESPGVAAFWKASSRTLHLDGAGKNPPSVLWEVYTHEFMHAIDYVGPSGTMLGRYSDTPEWAAIWKKELTTGKLSDYAGTNLREGFAEYGRMVVTAPATAELDFPEAFAFFTKHRLT